MHAFQPTIQKKIIIFVRIFCTDRIHLIPRINIINLSKQINHVRFIFFLQMSDFTPRPPQKIIQKSHPVLFRFSSAKFIIQWAERSNRILKITSYNNISFIIYGAVQSERHSGFHGWRLSAKIRPARREKTLFQT